MTIFNYVREEHAKYLNQTYQRTEVKMTRIFSIRKVTLQKFISVEVQTTLLKYSKTELHYYN